MVANSQLRGVTTFWGGIPYCRSLRFVVYVVVLAYYADALPCTRAISAISHSFRLRGIVSRFGAPLSHIDGAGSVLRVGRGWSGRVSLE
jgi:hypothetical protein